MAGYRPKSLEELNNMYDKTMAAEKAIKKGTSLLEKSEESSSAEEITNADIQQNTDEVKQSQELSDAVNEFIAKYSGNTAPVQPKEEASKPKPQMTILTQEPVKTEKVHESTNQTNAPSQEPVRTEREPEKNDRSNLMDEYMRIMTDEDDDIPQKKLSRKEKKKLKRKEKNALQTENEGDFSEEEASAEQEIPLQEANEETGEEPVINEEALAQNIEQATEISAEEEDNDDFDFPENYTPEWIKQDEETELTDNQDAAEPEEEKGNKSKKGKRTALKALLGIILAAVIALGIFATLFKTVVAVNTGKAFSDSYYVFTAYKDYDELSILEGDLIITEKSYAEDGDIFAYIDYSERTFEFGKRSDSITNDDGEVLLVTERDGSRTLVSRDDCRGVVYMTYPTVGKYISLVTDNFIVVIAAVAILALIIVLILTLALRDKKEKKSKDEAEETAEESEEDENLFAGIG